ncbi:MAG: radical SAM family heme chaperone HemW [Opitutae bacterium]|nr:radical SAM family heme chaperone HemW [Opitutae bacterium]MBT5380324.1 radical SAM family heme chaperone HemW [Opitutae bacterium]MBT5689556.1 radical SAM family heme chaperone HemW [Opitutae bacterium]MBT7854417.1 radical SAM family heme chaperone HemW [Opitutae bacterium]
MDLSIKNVFLEDLQAKAKKEISLGVYVHVPFCASTCDFCAFYQETPLRRDLLNFLETIGQEMNQFVSPGNVNTAFWGGGTPGLLPAGDLEKLGRYQLEALGVPAEEWTVEMAPSTVKPDKLKVLRELGVNRISLGVQSFQDEMLDAIGRRQSSSQALDAYDRIREAGFDNVNIDLMFALPNQTMDLWIRDLEKLRELSPDHVSTYCLTFEEDTALYVKLSKGQIIQDVEREADFYERTWERLDAMGLQQYEVSNFTRPGKACQHNLNTWKMHEWIGFGPSASSQFAGRRFTNDANLKTWMSGVESGNPVFMDESELTPDELALDSIIFGLRMNEGIDLDAVYERFPGLKDSGVEAFLNSLVKEGLTEASGRIFRLTVSGRLVVDRIGAELMDL